MDEEPPLSSNEIRSIREFIDAKKSTKIVIIFVRDVAKFVALIAAAVAAYKYLLAGWISGR